MWKIEDPKQNEGMLSFHNTLGDTSSRRATLAARMRPGTRMGQGSKKAGLDLPMSEQADEVGP